MNYCRRSIGGHKWWMKLILTVSSFSICAQGKEPQTIPVGKFMPLPTPQRPWSHLDMEFITDLPESDGNTAILEVLDSFSRSLWLIHYGSLWFNHVFRYFSLPEDVVSDRSH